MTRTVLILTQEDDEHAHAVANRLGQRGASPVLFNPAQLPGRAQLVCGVGNGQLRRLLRVGAQEIDLGALTSIWLRRPQPPECPPTSVGNFVLSETMEALNGLLGSAPCPWLPARPQVIKRADLKAEQLVEAQQLGFEVPPTLITNSPTEALEFINRHEGQVISKALNSSAFSHHFPQLARYTELIERRDLASLGRVQGCPVVFQAYVPKRVELRVTIVGTRVFAAEIDSQRSRYSRVDWRRYDLNSTPYRRHALPAEVERLCLTLLQRFGLGYGAIDLILRPDGHYVFLELNPTGQFSWIESLTGFPITDAVTDVLLGSDAQRAAA